VIGASSCNIAKTKAIEQLLVIAVQAPTPRHSPQTKKTPTQKPSSRTDHHVVLNEVEYRIRSCRIEEARAVCDVEVTNNGEDRILYLRAHDLRESTWLCDNFNVSRKADTVQILDGGQETSRELVVPIVQGQMTVVRVRSLPITPVATSLMSLNIRGKDSRKGGYFTVSIPNIPLSN
jgi:hypothetical protein